MCASRVAISLVVLLTNESLATRWRAAHLLNSPLASCYFFFLRIWTPEWFKAILLDGIVRVVFLRPFEQVARSATRWIVTVMENALIWFQRFTLVCQKPCDDVCADITEPWDMKITISFSELGSRPFPAAITFWGIVHLQPKTSNRFGWDVGATDCLLAHS